MAALVATAIAYVRLMFLMSLFSPLWQLVRIWFWTSNALNDNTFFMSLLVQFPSGFNQEIIIS